MRPYLVKNSAPRVLQGRQLAPPATHPPLLKDELFDEFCADACLLACLHNDLFTRRGTATQTVLLMDSWRPGRKGAAVLVFTWATKQLEVVSLFALRHLPWKIWDLEIMVPAPSIRSMGSCCDCSLQSKFDQTMKHSPWWLAPHVG